MNTQSRENIIATYKKLLIIGVLLSLAAFCMHFAPFVTLKISTRSGFELAYEQFSELLSGQKTFIQLIKCAFINTVYTGIAHLGLCFGDVRSLVSAENLIKNRSTEAKTDSSEFKLKIKDPKRFIVVLLGAYSCLAIVVCALDWSVVSVTGYNTNPFAHIGIGAIAAGILTMAELLLCLYQVYFAWTKIRPFNINDKQALNADVETEQIADVQKTDIITADVKPGNAVAGSKSISEQLKELASLRDEGLISESDYEAKKKQILSI